METEENTLMKNLEHYENQLAQINLAISSSADASNKQDLKSLKKDIEELIFLTKETLSSVKQPSSRHTKPDSNPSDPFSEEYALFKAEIDELEGNSSFNSNRDESEDTELDSGISPELQADLDALKGSKCQAPHKQNWGDESFHNALIVNIETTDSVEAIDNIQVRVLFVNPTEKDMLPCPYYLEGECRFTDDKCHFSHGELVPLASIREYREPDFSLIKEGSHVLAKQKDKLWHRAKVQSVLRDNQCLVKFESKGRESVELDLHDLLPLDGGNDEDEEESSGSSSGSEEEVVPQEHFVQMSLLREPPSKRLGDWEKHTKGIGSRLMASMGYVVGCGLGKYGEGRLEPVEAMAYPPGKSLDACMALREAAGGDQDMFKAERRQKQQQRKLLRIQRHNERQEAARQARTSVFTFLNHQLANSAVKKAESSNRATLASSSNKGLNIERFRLGENIKKTQKDIEKYNQSLKRHDKGSTTYKAITNKLEEAKSELNRLQSSDNLIVKEQSQRDGRKKMSVF